MTNEWAEFLAYTGQPVYTAASKRDHAYLGRFAMEMIQEFSGLGRVLTILARGYLYHNVDGSPAAENPYDRIELARRALCAWCSVPEKQKSSGITADFRALSAEFPELVDDKGRGWFYRHVKSVISFVRTHPDVTDRWMQNRIEPIAKRFTSEWKGRVHQLQVPIFHYKTKGAWLRRLDDMLAEALEAGPLRTEEYPLPVEWKNRLEQTDLNGVPLEVAAEVVRFYLANRRDDTPWVVLPVVNFDAYFGGTSFSRKWLSKLPEQLIQRDKSKHGISRIQLLPHA